MPENSDVGTNVGTAVTATDDDNDTLTYSLGGTDASSFDFDTSTGQITTKTGITYDFEGTNSYTVTVDVRDSKDSDGDADTADDDSITVTITVLDLNETPVVSGSAAENFAEIKFDVDPATLTEADYEIGSYTAYDDDGDSVAWDVSGTDAAHFSIDSDGILSFAIEPDFENPADLADADGMGRSDNEYVVVVEADDGQGETNSVGTFEVTVTVTNVNEAPEVTGGSATPSHPEFEHGSDPGIYSFVVDTYTARDEEGEAVTWRLGGNDAGDFIINSSTGRLIFRIQPDYEMPAGAPASPGDPADNTYEIIVKARDTARNERDFPVTVTVTNVEEAGTVSISGTLSGGEEITASLTDPDGTPSSVRWRWARGNTATGTFANISGATAATYTLVADDVGKYLRATASYTDPEGSGKSANRVTGQVGAGNSEPTFDDGATATRTVPENSAMGTSVGTPVAATDTDNDTLTYSLAGTDRASFDIDSSNGQIETKSGVTYDFEGAKTSYTVTVNVRDSKDSAGGADTANDDSITVTINLTNADDAGTVSISGTLDGGEEITASLTDPDGTPSSVTWQWARGDSASGPFTNISGATAAKYTLVAADVGKYLRATASYTDPEGSGKSANGVTSQISAGNAEPMFSATTATRTVPENSAMGTNVGGAVTARDTDSGDTLTYSLSGTDRASFNINTSTGQITTRSGVTYDFEGTNSYTVTVNVRDSKDSAGDADTATDDSITVTINLTNVNEAPTIQRGLASFNVNENFTPAVITIYSAVDMDASTTLTWSLEGDDAGHFRISTNMTQEGFLWFQISPDYEDPADDDEDNVYNLTVKVTDNGSPRLTDTRDVALTILDLNETPVISGDSSDTFAEIEFDVAPADLADADYEIGSYTAYDDDDSVTWDVSGTDAAHFSINSTTGVLSFSIEPDFENPADLADADNMGASDNEYVVVVEADDGQGETNSVGTFEVTVTVTNVNETPEVTGGSATPSHPEIEYDGVQLRRGDLHRARRGGRGHHLAPERQ